MLQRAGERRPDINFIVVAVASESKITGSTEININDIQPLEDLVKKETIDFFLAHPEKIFNMDRSIKVSISHDSRFKYYVVDGTNRLFACFKLGHLRLLILPDFNIRYPREGMAEVVFSDVLDTYARGIRKWSDLRARIVTEKEYDAEMHRREVEDS